MAGCIYCGGSSKTTKEHAWPAWTDEFVPGSEVRFRYKRTASGGAAHEWKTSGINVKVRVCRDCNNGWMADLENEVRPIISSLIVGPGSEGAVLKPAEQLVVAKWVVKTSQMLERALGRPVIPPDRYDDFYRERQPGPATVAWLFAYAGREPGYNLIRRALHIGEAGAKGAVNAYCITATVGHFGFQVFDQMTGDHVSISRDPSAPCVAVWPGTSVAVKWPPKDVALNDEGFLGIASALESSVS